MRDSSYVRRFIALIVPLLRRLGVGVIVSVVCLAGFLAIAEDILEKEPLRVDQWLAFTPPAVRSQITTAVMLLTLFGYQALIVIGLLVGIVLLLRQRRLEFVIWLVALVGGQLLNTLLKMLFARPRPVFETPLVNEGFYSFPSGHSMMSVITYGLLAYLVVTSIHSRVWRVVVAVIAVLLIFVIGASRVYLGAHYPTDVIGGFAAGIVWLVACISALRYGRSRHLLGSRGEIQPT